MKPTCGQMIFLTFMTSHRWAVDSLRSPVDDFWAADDFWSCWFTVSQFVCVSVMLTRIMDRKPLHLLFRRLVTCLVWSWNVLSLTADLTVNFTSDLIWSHFFLSCFYDRTPVGKNVLVNFLKVLPSLKTWDCFIQRNTVQRQSNVWNRTNIYSGK